MATLRCEEIELSRVRCSWTDPGQVRFVDRHDLGELLGTNPSIMFFGVLLDEAVELFGVRFYMFVVLLDFLNYVRILALC